MELMPTYLMMKLLIHFQKSLEYECITSTQHKKVFHFLRLLRSFKLPQIYDLDRPTPKGEKNRLTPISLNLVKEGNKQVFIERIRQDRADTLQDN